VNTAVNLAANPTAKPTASKTSVRRTRPLPCASDVWGICQATTSMGFLVGSMWMIDMLF
jgi:hypothetical protein